MAEARVRSRHLQAGEHHGSPWPFVVAVGAALGYTGLVLIDSAYRFPMMAFGIIIFLAGILGWVRDDIRRPATPFYGVDAPAESRFPRVSARKLGIWLFLSTEIMFFSAIIGAAWALRFRTTTDPSSLSYYGPWALPGQILNIPGTAVATFILICSSLTMVEALAAIERGDQKRLKLFLGATMLLGLTFLVFQANEFYHLYFADGLTWTTAPYGVNRLFGPTFFIQTGTHGAHVTAGVIAMGYTFSKALKGGFTKENHETVELVGLYWHFVDVVWIFLFTLVYLI